MTDFAQRFTQSMHEAGIDPTAMGMSLLMSNNGQRNVAQNLGAALLQGRQARLTQIQNEAARTAGLRKEAREDRKYDLDERKLQLDAWKAANPNVNTQIKKMDMGNGMEQAYMFNPSTETMTPWGDPYPKKAGIEINMNPDGTPMTTKQKLAKQREEREFGKIGADYEAAEGKQSMLIDIGQMRQLNEQGLTGPGAETIDSAKRGVATLARIAGVDLPEAWDSDLATADAIRGKGMDFIMQRIAGTKGAISEKEMRAFEQASPGMAKTAAGNSAMLNFMEANIMGQLDYAQHQEAYMAENGSLKGFEKARRAYLRDFPKTAGGEANFAVNHQNFGNFQDYLDADSIPQASQPPQNTQPQVDSDIPTGTPQGGFIIKQVR